MRNRFTRKIGLSLLIASALAVTAYATCNCVFTQQTSSQIGTGFLAQTDIYDDGCTAWTLARYSGSSAITADRIIKGRFCSNGQNDDIVEVQENDDYILAEYYWNLTTEDVHDKGRSKVIKDGSNQAQTFVDP